MISFLSLRFNVTEFSEVDRLFSSRAFQDAALKVCPKNKRFLDPFQFNFIMQGTKVVEIQNSRIFLITNSPILVPGQTVAEHVDAVYFWGATRFQVPQWLLAVMQYSGLFQKEFIDQIQVLIAPVESCRT